MDLEILDLMGQINRACQAALQQSEVLKTHDISVFPARLLSVISRNPGCSQQDLAGMLERDKAQIARTIRELEAKGLVTRIAHRTDWRSLCPMVTEAGLRIAEQLNHERAELAGRLMLRIESRDKPLLAGLLRQMLVELVPAGAAPPATDEEEKDHGKKPDGL